MKYDTKIRKEVEDLVRTWFIDPALGYPRDMTLSNCIFGAHGECAAMIFEFGEDAGFAQWKVLTLQKRNALGKNPKAKDDYDFKTKDGVPVDAKAVRHFHKNLIVTENTHAGHLYDELWSVKFDQTLDNFEIRKISCAEFDSKCEKSMRWGSPTLEMEIW